MTRKKRKPVKGPLGCGKCMNGYVYCSFVQRPDDAKPYTVSALGFCLCERGQWRHQLWRKRQFSRVTD